MSLIFSYLKLIGVRGKFQHVPALSKLVIRDFSSDTSGNFVENLKKKLTVSLKPEYLDVINESDSHNVPKGSASHIRVIIVSSLFNDKKLVQRHRLVNDVLQEELKGAIHALSIQAISATEMKDEVEKKDSPPCRGGSKE